ncbi:hypothetical protein [Thalassiella azotivora]
MTISSIGYDFTTDGPVTEPEWALAATHHGAPYAVDGATSWRVEIVAGQDRTVRIKAGRGYGHGILDTSDADETRQLPVVSGAAGTHRWDLIVARRNWQPPGGVTAFASIQGTSSEAIPAGRLRGPGVEDDQPLALVRVTSGQQLPTALIDLRCWASKVTGAKHVLGLGDPVLGAEGRVGRVVYRGVDNGAGGVVWAAEPYSVGRSEKVKLNASGDFTITLPEAFPTELVSWDGTNGDFVQHGGLVIEARAPGAGGANSTRQYLRGKATRLDGTFLPINSEIRVNYTAWGW